MIPTLALGVCPPAAANAAQSAALHVAFAPDRLGAPTTAEIAVRIAARGTRVPSPLTAVDVSYPGDLGITVSGLGLDTCTEVVLADVGPEACPANSIMGHGSVLAELAIGPEVLREPIAVAIVRAPEQDGHFAMLFYAGGGSPISAEIPLPAQLVPAGRTGSIHIQVPLVPTVPGGPNVSVAQLKATIGPRGLTYYERVHGKTVGYRPTGILLPDQCPPGGFPFSASLAFEDGTYATARAAVPCPRPTPGEKLRISRSKILMTTRTTAKSRQPRQGDHRWCRRGHRIGCPSCKFAGRDGRGGCGWRWRPPRP